MSGSNPFRRDRPFAQTPTTATSGREDDDIDAPIRFPPLNIDTSTARATTQTKHVQFASPPAPETPLSYSYPSSSASSPESLRHTGPLTSPFNRPTVGIPLPADPFHSDDSDTSNERSDGGHPKDTKAEPPVTPSAAQHGLNWLPAELQSSSGNIAATPEALSVDGGSDARTMLGQIPGRGKQAIDVDAFKRLLLTGESGTSASGGTALPPVTPAHTLIQGDSSSSTADSASVSRQSIFEPIISTSTETPRTSHELDFDDANVERRSLSSSVASQARQKPSVPRTRHGKMLTGPNSSTPAAATSVGIGEAPLATVLKPTSRSPTAVATKDLNKPLPPPSPPTELSPPVVLSESPELGISLPARTKRPPTPPLTRRQSQIKSTKPQIARSSSSKTYAVEETSPSSPADLQKLPFTLKAPPPPPQRRLNRASTYGTPSSEAQLLISDSPRRPSGSFLADLNTATDKGFPQPSDPPSRTPSSGSGASASVPGTATPGPPPPPPPPRRMRGLSKSSIDSQRPASFDLRRPSVESSRNVSGTSNATDILADLAALQREVDALRNSQGGRRVS